MFFSENPNMMRNPWEDALNTQGPESQRVSFLQHPRNSGRHVLKTTLRESMTQVLRLICFTNLCQKATLYFLLISLSSRKQKYLTCSLASLTFPFIWVLEKANLEKPTPTNHGQRRKYLPVLLGEMLVPTCVGRCWKAKNRLNLGHGHPWLKKTWNHGGYT